MPTHDQLISMINPKSLQRNSVRAVKVMAMHRIKYGAKVSLQLVVAQRELMKRIKALSQPVERIIGKGDNAQVVMVHDDKALCDAVHALCAAIERQRVVLGIPGPPPGRPPNERSIHGLGADLEAEAELMPADAQTAQGAVYPPEPATTADSTLDAAEDV